MKRPIVREDYMDDCFKRQKKLSYILLKSEEPLALGVGWGVRRKWSLVLLRKRYSFTTEPKCVNEWGEQKSDIIMIYETY